VSANEGQRYLLRRAGYGLNDDPAQVILTSIAGGNGQATCDPYHWGGGSRTMTVAHEWLREHFDDIEDGAVVCVEHILGERKEPKRSERLEDGP
jgi:hypothetical protein